MVDDELHCKIASFDEDMRCLTALLAGVLNKAVEVGTLVSDTYVQLFAESTIAELEQE